MRTQHSHFKQLSLLAAVIGSLFFNAQAAVLQGHLVKNVEHGEPVANIPLAASGNVKGQSKADGSFQLQFADKQVGDEVVLQIQHPDWWVLHEMMLSRTLPAEGGADMQIVLCKLEECDARAFDYFRSKTELAIQAYYAQEIAQLKARGGKTEQLIQLQNQRGSAMLRANEYSVFFTKLRAASMSAQMRQAVELFLRGKLSRAIAVLPEENLESIASKPNAREEVALLWLLRGKFALMRGEITSAEKAFQKSVQLNSDDAWAQLALAEVQYLQNQNARAGFEKGLQLTRSNKQLEASAMALYALVSVNMEQNRITDAIANCEELAQTYRQLASKLPLVYFPELIKTYNNLGTLHGHIKSQEEVRKVYQLALDIARQQNPSAPALYTPFVVSTLYNIGVSFRKEGRNEEARKFYLEAIQVYKQQTAAKSEDELRDVAAVYLNLGNLSSSQRQPKQAREEYEAALAISRDLAKRSNGAAMTEVSSALNNLGLLHFSEKRAKEAELAYGEALDIRRKLARINPEVFLPKVAATLNNLAMLHAGEERWQDARKEFEEALKIRQQLAKARPEQYLSEVADTLSNLGLLYGVQKKSSEARLVLEEALSIYRHLLAGSKNQTSLNNAISNVEKMLLQL